MTKRKQNITLDKLAQIVQGEFERASKDTKERFDGVDLRFDGVDIKLNGVDRELKIVNHKIDTLARRVDAMVDYNRRIARLERMVDSLVKS